MRGSSARACSSVTASPPPPQDAANAAINSGTAAHTSRLDGLSVGVLSHEIVSAFNCQFSTSVQDCLLITAARYPAPKPLSILTTAPPAAQAFSIASSGASPRKLAPSPTDVGTAMTGVATSPATT